jgi:hypothetical protein
MEKGGAGWGGGDIFDECEDGYPTGLFVAGKKVSFWWSDGGVEESILGYVGRD